MALHVKNGNVQMWLQYKRGSKDYPYKYGPVSLTSYVCKILELMITDEMMAHLKKYNLIKEMLHGFCSKEVMFNQFIRICKACN